MRHKPLPVNRTPAPARATPRRSRRIPPAPAAAERILIELCSVPTAPFVEDQVVEYIRRFVSERPKLRLTTDDFGNLLITLPGKRVPRWVFTAHMDHPGFIARRMIDPLTVEADFRGGVRAEYFAGERVRFFVGQREIPATVIAALPGEDRPYPGIVTLSVDDKVTDGSLGMWDQGIGRIENGRFYSRVCDDLAGAAAALAMLDVLLVEPAKAPVAVLLTRAEEEGFIGAIGAVLHPKLLRKSDRVIAIECSAVQPYAPQGAGAIIRVGDRTSIFNSSLSYFLTQQAEALAKADSSFRYQRSLMPGGTCEATVYDAWGYHAGSICVPLGNYHNMDTETKRIGPEYIDLADWHSMVKLFIEVARAGAGYVPGLGELKKRVEERFEKLRHLMERNDD
jgi:putative aminopeptidase FrvX